jgi:hypothetical protein
VNPVLVVLLDLEPALWQLSGRALSFAERVAVRTALRILEPVSHALREPV